MHRDEKYVNDYVKYDLRAELEVFLKQYERKRRVWYILPSLVLVIIMVVLVYIALVFNKWNTLWEQQAIATKEARAQFLQDREDWRNDSLEIKHIRIPRKKE
jgi:hypothetical protein